jgi:hypothetical protein
MINLFLVVFAQKIRLVLTFKNTDNYGVRIFFNLFFPKTFDSFVFLLTYYYSSQSMNICSQSFGLCWASFIQFKFQATYAAKNESAIEK